MAGVALVGTNKKIVLDTKRNIFGLTDVVATLRFGDKKKEIPMQEIIDSSVSDFASAVTVAAPAEAGTYTLIVNDASAIQPNNVLLIGSGSTQEYVVVKSVDVSTNTVALRYKMKYSHGAGEEVHKVGNTGFYEAIWYVDLNDADLGPLNIGDTILVDVSSPSAGLLFEGQTFIIRDNEFERFNAIENLLNEANAKLDSMIGWNDEDMSRVLV